MYVNICTHVFTKIQSISSPISTPLATSTSEPTNTPLSRSTPTQSTSISTPTCPLTSVFVSTPDTLLTLPVSLTKRKLTQIQFQSHLLPLHSSRIRLSTQTQVQVPVQAIKRVSCGNVQGQALVQREEQEHKIVSLNVGGLCYTTTQSTLLRIPNTYFTRQLPYLENVKEIVINRNGIIFEDILDYLRDGVIFLPPSNTKELLELEEEARFFGLEDLVLMCLNNNGTHVFSCNLTQIS
eukprot:TRINITY_DN2497_c0_g1_i22.p1 TRINITY_DN2497_c0_g1~~TRINITY_DN2497_c0_g1_i22.p1  ORF type:complete len:238 (+),score=28.38 TRINITY_DN2497_c0_g1_i22:381-1094(+)